MNSAEVEQLKLAREALARQRNAIAKRLAESDLAPVALAEDMTRILKAVETVDRALTDAGRPYVLTEEPTPAFRPRPRRAAKPGARLDAKSEAKPDEAVPETSAARAKRRLKETIQADRDAEPA